MRWFFVAVWVSTLACQPHMSQVSFGVIADCQYADQDDRGARLYRKSKTKLGACVDTLNNQRVEHVFHLGDFIDTGAENFEVVHAILEKLSLPYTHVLGNHDYSVADDLKPMVPAKMGLPAPYFSLDIKGWRFLIIDGNDLSLHAHAKDSDQYKYCLQLYNDHYSDRPNWNGAIGEQQMNWMREQLDAALVDNIPVILLCHFPVFPPDPHNLWNDDEVLDLIVRYDNVKAWMNGHNHAGAYGVKDGIHFITFRGMVDTEENAFATVYLSESELEVVGFGREVSRKLMIRKGG